MFEKFTHVKYYQCLCNNHHYTIRFNTFDSKCSKCSSEIIWHNFVDSVKAFGLYEHIPILRILNSLENPNDDTYHKPIIGKAELVNSIWEFSLNGNKDCDADFYLAKAKCVGTNRTNIEYRNMIVFLDERRVMNNGYGLFNFISFDPEKPVLLDIDV